MKYLFFIAFILSACSKDHTDYSTTEILGQGGWQVVSILSKDSAVIQENKGLPELIVRFNKNGIINGNMDGKFTLLSETSMRFYMSLDTNYWPYPIWYEQINTITKKEQDATISIRSIAEFELITDNNRLVFYRY